MAGPPTEIHIPSQRGLRTVRGVRAQLVTLFREAKAGLIEPVLVGRLAHILNILQSMDNGLLLSRRVEDLETSVKPKPNGRAELRP